MCVQIETVICCEILPNWYVNVSVLLMIIIKKTNKNKILECCINCLYKTPQKNTMLNNEHSMAKYCINDRKNQNKMKIYI